MPPGSELGDHAAVGRVNGVLRGDHVREHATAVGQHRRRRFIARALDAEDDHTRRSRVKRRGAVMSVTTAPSPVTSLWILRTGLRLRGAWTPLLEHPHGLERVERPL